MNLTQEQIQTIATWVAENASISDVQKKLAEVFGISMTYMDVRFLIDDIGAQLQDKPEPVKDVVESSSQADAENISHENAPEDFGDMPQEQMQEYPENPQSDANVGGVKVSVSCVIESVF